MAQCMRVSDGDEQMFGAKGQVTHAGGSYKKADGSAAQFL